VTEASTERGQHDTTTTQLHKRDTNPGGDGGNGDTKDDLLLADGQLDQTTELQKTVMKIITIKDFVT
jgi:hypothetical protein